MRKTATKIAALTLSLIMVLASIPFGAAAGLKSLLPKASAQQYRNGDTFYFGSYPQRRVQDEEITAALNAKAADAEWISYGYYAGNGNLSTCIQGDWMRYCDIEHDGARYRGVVFSQYRPYLPFLEGNDGYIFQPLHGYVTNTTYWFRWEPLEWRILDADYGFVMSEKLIDAQAFNIGNMYSTAGVDYENSDIREWLNDTFYNAAFSETEKELIDEAWLDEYGYVTDNVFLLTYADVLDPSNGFSSSEIATDQRRLASGTDYAKCQGLYDVSASGLGITSAYSNWSLMTTYETFLSTFGGSVDYNGRVGYNGTLYDTSMGIRPAFFILDWPESELTFTEKDDLFTVAEQTTLYKGNIENPVPLRAVLFSADGKCTGSDVQWRSSNSSVLEITDTHAVSSGESTWVLTADFKAKKEGTVTVTVSAPGVASDSVTVQVIEQKYELKAEIELDNDFFYLKKGMLFDADGNKKDAVTANIRLTNLPDQGMEGKTLRNISVQCTADEGMLFENGSNNYTFTVSSLSPNETVSRTVKLLPQDNFSFPKDTEPCVRKLSVTASTEKDVVKASAGFTLHPANTLLMEFAPDPGSYTYKDGELFKDGLKAAFIKGTLTVRNCMPDKTAPIFSGELRELLDFENVRLDAAFGDHSGLLLAGGYTGDTKYFDMMYGEIKEFEYRIEFDEAALTARMMETPVADITDSIPFTLTSMANAFKPIRLNGSFEYHFDALFVYSHIQMFNNVKVLIQEKSFFKNTSFDSDIKLGACKVWDALDILDNAVTFDFGELFYGEPNFCKFGYFDAYVGDLLLNYIKKDLPSELETEMKKSFESYHLFYDFIEGAIKTMPEWTDDVIEKTSFEFMEFAKDSLYSPSINFTSVLLKLDDKGSDLSKGFASFLYEMGCAAETINDCCDMLGKAADTYTAFRKIYKAVTLAKAYQTVTDSFYENLEIAAKNMKQIDPDYAASFSASVAKAKAKAYPSIDTIIEAIISVEAPLTELIYNVVAKDFAYSQVAAVLGFEAAGPAAAVIFAYDATFEIMDKIVMVGDLTEQYEIMNYVSPVEKGLQQNVTDKFNKLAHELTYSNAVSYDEAFRQLKLTNMYLYDAAYKFTKANLFHAGQSHQEYVDEMDTIAALKNSWNNVSCHASAAGEVNYKKVTVKCPVDMYVYDAAGALAAAIANEQIGTQDEKVTVLVAEGEKSVVIPAGESYSVKIVARESGEMTYRVTELKDIETLRVVETIQIPLQAEQVFEGTTPTVWDGPKEGYALHTNGETVTVSSDVILAQKPGDVDGDGNITASDARLCLRRAVDLEDYAVGSFEFTACDVDKDGSVTANDARSILRAAVGLEDPTKW